MTFPKDDSGVELSKECSKVETHVIPLEPEHITLHQADGVHQMWGRPVCLLSQLHLSFFTASVQLDLVDCTVEMQEAGSSRLSRRSELVRGFMMDEEGRAVGEAFLLPRLPDRESPFLFSRSRATMKQELFAYLIGGDGQVSDMPTDELLVALDHLLQRSTPQEQSLSCDRAATYEFLQTVKRAMRISRDVSQASWPSCSNRTENDVLRHHPPDEA
jgi:hypothetical protein